MEDADTSLRKRFKALPWENETSPRGRLNVEAKKLRVEPPAGGGAMATSELQELCTGLASNTHVTHLDLDGNQFALGCVEEDEALDPLVELCRTNKRLVSLDVSNNGLCFEEDSGQVAALEKLVVESGLTTLMIGGSMDIDEDLLRKIGTWVVKSERRWRNVGLGKLDDDEDVEEAADELRATVRRAANAVEAAALADYLKRPRLSAAAAAAARPPLTSVQSLGGRDPAAAPPAQPACPAQVSPRSPKRPAPADVPPPAQPAPAETSPASSTSPSTKKRKAEAAAAADTTPAAPPATPMPAGASEERCKAFLAAFHDIRGDESQLAQGPTLAQIAETLHYETSEMEYYLSCMVDLNFIMVVGGQIYII